MQLCLEYYAISPCTSKYNVKSFDPINVLSCVAGWFVVWYIDSYRDVDRYSLCIAAQVQLWIMKGTTVQCTRAATFIPMWRREIVKDRPVNVAGRLHIRNNFIHTPCTTVWMVDPILYPGTILLQIFYVDDLEDIWNMLFKTIEFIWACTGA